MASEDDDPIYAFTGGAFALVGAVAGAWVGFENAGIGGAILGVFGGALVLGVFGGLIGMALSAVVEVVQEIWIPLLIFFGIVALILLTLDVGK